LSPAGVDSEEDDNEPIHSECHSTMHTNETAGFDLEIGLLGRRLDLGKG